MQGPYQRHETRFPVKAREFQALDLDARVGVEGEDSRNDHGGQEPACLEPLWPLTPAAMKPIVLKMKTKITSI